MGSTPTGTSIRCKMATLLLDNVWEPLLALLRGKRWGYYQLPGNVGDYLIAEGTFALFRRNHIEFGMWSEPYNFDGLLISGGGNIGGYYQNIRNIRTTLLNNARKLGKQVIILPQSVIPGGENEVFPDDVTLFCREWISARFYKNSIFCPDLALAHPIVSGHHRNGSLIALRRDGESVFHSHNFEDPIDFTDDVDEYLTRASCFSEIITDRLHFAIAGLLAGCRVTLLPNSYHKNRAMWESSLCFLGCDWSNVVPPR